MGIFDDEKEIKPVVYEDDGRKKGRKYTRKSPKNKVRLNTIPKVRRYLATLINEVHNGVMPEYIGKSLAYISKIIIECLEKEAGGDLLGEIEKIKEHLNKQGNMPI